MKNGISNTKLWHVIKGRICKKGKKLMYKVKFQIPMTNLVASKWISVEDIADLQQKQPVKRRIFCKIFLVPLSNRSAETLRHEVVSCLINNPGFLDMGWEVYLRQMQSDGTFGDKITLRAMSEIFNVEFDVISTLRPAARQITTPHNSVANFLPKIFFLFL